MSESIEREYPYRLDPYFLWAAPPFFGLMSGFALYTALTNSDPVLLQGILEIPAVPWNILMGVLGVLFAFLFVGSVVFVVQALTTRPKRIAFTTSTLVLPKGCWSSAEQAIPYVDIVELAIQTLPPPANCTRTLLVRHKQGKVPIEETLLPSKADFEELWGTLESRVAANARPQGNSELGGRTDG